MGMSKRNLKVALTCDEPGKYDPTRSWQATGTLPIGLYLSR
jgi:hypothetical protein